MERTDWKKIMNSQRGFTLVEGIMVIAIIAIVATIAVPQFRKMAVNGNLKAAAKDIISDFTAVREMALSQNQNYSLVFDQSNNRYTVPGLGNPKSPGYFASDIHITAVSFGTNPLIFQTRGTTSPPEIRPYLSPMAGALRPRSPLALREGFMFSTISNRKGISLVEVCIALFLLGFGIFALISLQPSAWRLSGKSDYLGRASGILLSQLQATEAQIMNPNIAIPASGSFYPVYASGQGSAKQGDVGFTVNRTITALAGGNTWRITIQVSWPGNASGIQESLNVTRQEYFRQ